MKKNRLNLVSAMLLLSGLSTGYLQAAPHKVVTKMYSTQQDNTCVGQVVDQKGETVIGASVIVKGTSNGTITDLDGNYSIKVPSKATLTISYIGMKTLDIAVKGQSQINVTLSDDTQALDEVVVIGYGTVAKKDLTGSVSSVSAKQIAAIPVSSASEALQGKMAGVSITTTEGSPDADVKIRVRGGGYSISR